MKAPNRLYRNNGDGTFTDVASELGVAEPQDSFSCWFWDYDNDGRLDLFVAGFRGFLYDVIADALGQSHQGERLRLYRNLGDAGFRDVTNEVGLGLVFLTMGSNFGDVDNDGYLDVYLGTGLPNYSNLHPNVMLKNVGGLRFADISVSSGRPPPEGTRRLLCRLGRRRRSRPLRGDGRRRARGRRTTSCSRTRGMAATGWISTRRHRDQPSGHRRGCGSTKGPDATIRSIYREVSSGSSYGGNSFVQHIGLDQAERADCVEAIWPVSMKRAVFRDVPADQTVAITEGAGSYETLVRRPLPTATGR